MLNFKSAIEHPVDELKLSTQGMLRLLHKKEGLQSSYQVIGCFQPKDANLVELPVISRQCLAIAYEGTFDARMYSVLSWAHINGALSAIKLIDVHGNSVHLVLNHEVRIENISAIEALWARLKNRPWPEAWDVCVVAEEEVLAGRSDTPHPELAADLLKSIVPLVERLWRPAIDVNNGVPVGLEYEAQDGLIDYLDDALLPERVIGNLQTPTPLRFSHTPLGRCGVSSAPPLSQFPCAVCGDSAPADRMSKFYETLHKLTGHEPQQPLISYLQVAQEASVSRKNSTVQARMSRVASFLAYLNLHNKHNASESDSED